MRLQERFEDEQQKRDDCTKELNKTKEEVEKVKREAAELSEKESEFDSVARGKIQEAATLGDRIQDEQLSIGEKEVEMKRLSDEVVKAKREAAASIEKIEQKTQANIAEKGLRHESAVSVLEQEKTSLRKEIDEEQTKRRGYEQEVSQLKDEDHARFEAEEEKARVQAEVQGLVATRMKGTPPVAVWLSFATSKQACREAPAVEAPAEEQKAPTASSCLQLFRPSVLSPVHVREHKVEYWSQGLGAWLDAVVVNNFDEDCVFNGLQITSGTVLLVTEAGDKWVQPQDTGSMIRRSFG